MIVKLTPGEMIDCLINGAVLERFEKEASDEFSNRYLYLYFDGIFYETKGWGSHYVKPEQAIMDIIKNPNNWVISDYTIEDKPWILKR
jgi:hypothetical protein